jgi:hypothetical protein
MKNNKFQKNSIDVFFNEKGIIQEKDFKGKIVLNPK